MPAAPTFLILMALATATSAATSPDLWPASLDSSLARAGIPRSATSLLVQEVDSGATTMSHRISEPMNPASVMKLVTTFAALDQLERLGPRGRRGIGRHQRGGGRPAHPAGGGGGGPFGARGGAPPACPGSACG